MKNLRTQLSYNTVYSGERRTLRRNTWLPSSQSDSKPDNKPVVAGGKLSSFFLALCLAHSLALKTLLRNFGLSPNYSVFTTPKNNTVHSDSRYIFSIYTEIIKLVSNSRFVTSDFPMFPCVGNLTSFYRCLVTDIVSLGYYSRYMSTCTVAATGRRRHYWHRRITFCFVQ
jgi:hypothetical protein